MNDKLVKLICDVFSVDEHQLEETLNIRELDDWDSLKHMEFVVRLEKIFNIELSADEIPRLKNLASIEGILAQKPPKS